MPRIGRAYLRPVYWVWNVARFVKNPGRYLWRRALGIPAIGFGPIRIGLNRFRISILGFSFGISARGITFRIPIISFLLGLLGGIFNLFGGGRGKRKGGSDRKRGGGDGGKKGKSGATERHERNGQVAREQIAKCESRIAALNRKIGERRQRIGEEDQRDRAKVEELRDRAKRGDREQQDLESVEKREQVEGEKREREKQETEEREKREQVEGEKREKAAREKREREKREQVEREKRDAAAHKERESEEREKRDAAARNERDREEREKRKKEKRKQHKDAVTEWKDARKDRDLRTQGKVTNADQEFDIAGDIPLGRVLLEASAGTGKTFNLTSLVVRYVVEEMVAIDDFLIVTFTRSAAANLREKTREKLMAALGALESRVSPDGLEKWLQPILNVKTDEAREFRINLLRDAITRLDGAMITTIHGFCQRTLSEVGLRTGGLSLDQVGASADSGSGAVIRDVVLSALARDVDHFGEDVANDPAKAETQIKQVVSALVSNSARAHPKATAENSITDKWVGAVGDVLSRQELARRNSGATSFDDLITELERIIQDDTVGADIKSHLRRRYKVILIDEFQDTDSKQWSIFNSIFQGVDSSPAGDHDQEGQRALIMVGDPKQAIYRFRGADINAYLQATSNDETVQRFNLATNFRSDRQLIKATNALLKDRQFGDERISYVQVTSPDKAPSGALSGAGAPLQIHWLPAHKELLAGGKSLTVDVARESIAEDLVNHVILLLNEGEIASKRGKRKVRESDITVLVRGKNDAIPIIEALRRRDIPVIQNSLESVLNTEAARQLSLLLRALENYSDARVVRALAFSWFVNVEHAKLLDEQFAETLQERCAFWADELKQFGIFAFYQRFRLDRQVVESIAARASQRGVESLERLLTDLEHVVELLHSRTERVPLDARGYLLELSSLATQPGEPEAQERRTESDLNAVKITTIHSSKGLEYPIVLIPFPKALQNKKPYVYSLEDGRFVDAAPLVEWTVEDLTEDERKRLAREEIDGDELRLFYVAATRAEFQTVIWWANTKGMGSSPLAKILFDETGSSRENVKVPKDDSVRDKLRELETLAPGLLTVKELAPTIESLARHTVPRPAEQPPQVAKLSRVELSRSSYWRWSYSAVKNSFNEHDYEAKSGGGDEPWRAASTDEIDPALILQSQPAGADYGTWFHKLMESIDFAHPDLSKHIGEIFDRRPYVNADRQVHISGVSAAIDTPLDQISQGFSLRTLSPSDRLDELDFLVGLGATDNAPRLIELAAMVAADDSHPFAEYFSNIAKAAEARSYQGLLKGSLDGLYRVRGEQVDKFVIVDFKTNRLRNYDYESMKQEMMLHDYPLQALIYTVALHRFLKTRLSSYQPSLHLAGSAYLFIRGMVGVDTPQIDGVRAGVFSWSYSPSIVERANQWFAGQPL